MDSAEFLRLVEQVAEDLPGFLRARIHNLNVMVMPRAPRELAEALGRHPDSILGVYQGVPFNRRGPFYGNVLPDTIVIFQQPLEALCRNEEEIKELVRRVTIHEIGHYFGLSDDELYRLESEK